MKFNDLNRQKLQLVRYLTAVMIACVSSAFYLGVQSAQASTFLNGDLDLVSNELRMEADSEVPLIHVTSDALKGYADIKLLLDSNRDILGLVYLTSDQERAEFRKAQLSEGGIVLVKKSGYDIVKLMVSESEFDLHSGGKITLRYLVNAVLGSSNDFPMEMIRVNDSWQIQTNDQQGRKPFTQMFLKGNFFFGQVLGIQGVSVK